MSAVIPGAAGPLPSAVAEKRPTPAFLVAYVLAWYGVNLALNGFAAASIPRLLIEIDNEGKGEALALVAGVGGIIVMIITPLFGRLSDRTRSRFGMRRPWLVGGAFVGLAGVFGLAWSTSVAQLVVFWCVVQIGFGATNMALNALLADQVPTRIRARVSAANGTAMVVAVITGSALVGAIPESMRAWWFLAPGIAAVALSLLLARVLRDVVLTEEPAPLSVRAVLGTYWLNPVRYRDFAWAWLCRFLVTMSILSISLYMLFFITDSLGVAKEAAPGVQAQALALFFVGNVATTILCAWISDRLGRRKIIVFAACLFTMAGLLTAMAVPTVGGFLIGVAIIGAGQGAFISVDVALMTEVLPSADDVGKDLGIVALSYQLPQVLVPVAAVPVLAVGGGDYLALYLWAAVLVVLGGLAILPVKGVR